MNNSSQRQRPALGEQVPLGTLYNARTDQFLPRSIFKAGHPVSQEDVSVTRFHGRPEVRVVLEDTYQTKFDLMNIAPDIAASILAKYVRLRGAGVYLDDTRRKDDTLHAAVYHKITTLQEKFQVMRTQHRENIDDEVLRNQQATHFVSGIEWGIQTIVSIEHMLSSSEDRLEVQSGFEAEIAKFKSAMEATQSSDEYSYALHETAVTPLEIKTYSDVFTTDGVLMRDLDEALYQLNLVPVHIEQEYSNKGQPTVYTLLPISVLELLMEVEISFGVPMTIVSPATERRFVQLFDQFISSREELKAYYAYISENQQCTTKGHLREVWSRLDKMQTTQQRFEKQYATTLLGVRSGSTEVGILDGLYETYTKGDKFPAALTGTTSRQLAKVKYVIAATQRGATYLSSHDDLNSISGKDAYVLSFSETAMNEDKHWANNMDLFQQLLNDRETDTLYIIADYDTQEQLLSRSYVSYYAKGEEVTRDILEYKHWVSEQCFVRCKPDTLEEENIQRPLKRRFITMPCPSPNCDRGRVCEWICFKCHGPVEFGFTDQYIYCDCGRSLFNNFVFKCSDHQSHGDDFEDCNQQHVLSQLKSLDDSDNVNILILGETGVGKSTFINAFVNYLTFETLDEAMAEDRLNWVIPCSFSTQVIDRSRPDAKIQQIEIKVGARV